MIRPLMFQIGDRAWRTALGFMEWHEAFRFSLTCRSLQHVTGFVSEFDFQIAQSSGTAVDNAFLVRVLAHSGKLRRVVLARCGDVTQKGLGLGLVNPNP